MEPMKDLEKANVEQKQQTSTNNKEEAKKKNDSDDELEDKMEVEEIEKMQVEEEEEELREAQMEMDFKRDFSKIEGSEFTPLSPMEIAEIQSRLDALVADWENVEGDKLWQNLMAVTNNLAQQLGEQVNHQGFGIHLDLCI